MEPPTKKEHITAKIKTPDLIHSAVVKNITVKRTEKKEATMLKLISPNPTTTNVLFEDKYLPLLALFFLAKQVGQYRSPMIFIVFPLHLGHSTMY